MKNTASFIPPHPVAAASELYIARDVEYEEYCEHRKEKRISDPFRLSHVSSPRKSKKKGYHGLVVVAALVVVAGVVVWAVVVLLEVVEPPISRFGELLEVVDAVEVVTVSVAVVVAGVVVVVAGVVLVVSVPVLVEDVLEWLRSKITTPPPP